MKTQSGLHTRQGFSARPHNGNGMLYPALSGLADNSVLADQIVCVALKYLDSNCDPNDPNLAACIDDKAMALINKYSNQSYQRATGITKPTGDALFNSYSSKVNYCAIFVWQVWYEATFCLGGVEGFEDQYLFKSSRVYDTNLSMRMGTQMNGKTLIDRTPARGSAFTRRRDTLSGGVGHAGIVVDVQEGQFSCVEANGDNGIPFEYRTYSDSDIDKYSMFFIHIENTPVKNSTPREDGFCCAPEAPANIGPCTNAAKPVGDGWIPTDAVMFQAITGGGDPTINAQHYIKQGFSFSPEYCWMRHESPKNTTTTTDPNQPGLKTTKRTGEVIVQCPDVQIQNCVQAVRVSASTFNAKSVPHFSVLYRNRLMGADITGSKWTFQTVGPRNGEGLGSALALPPPKALDVNGLPIPKYTNVDGDAIPDSAYSGFGTFSDNNGNLIVIVPEWMGARLNSLIGRASDNLPSVLGPQGFYQINCPAYTGNGAVHAQAADANFIVGSPEVIDGMDPRRLTATSNSLKAYPCTKNADRNGLCYRWVDENLFSGGTKFPMETLIFDFIVTNNDAAQPGLLNQIEQLGRKLDKPVLVVLKSSPPPFNWIEFAKQVITIAASFAPVVGIPPQIFTQALQAVNTVESIAAGRTDVLSSVVRIAGLVTSLLPESLRGEINNRIKDVAGETIVNTVNDSKQYLENATNFLTDISKAPNQAFQALGFDKSASELMQKKLFGALLPSIQNFSPSWYEFASDYAKNLKGDFDKGFQDGVKLLHSMETIKSTQQFGSYAASGAAVTDITRYRSALGIPEIQNLMITGMAGSVMAATPGITKVMAAIMQTRDILTNGSEAKGISTDTNISEIASVLKVANGFMGDATDFDRLTLQSLLTRASTLADKGVTKFILPPSLTKEQQECWGKELNQCIGIEIIGNNITFKKDTTPTKDNPPPVTVPPCIRTVNGSFMYCPPVTCKTGLSDAYNPSANYELRCTKVNQPVQELFNKATQTADKYGNAVYTLNGVNFLYFGPNEGLYSPYASVAKDAATGQNIELYGSPNGYLCEMVEVAPTPTKTLPTATTPTATTPTAPAEQPCSVLYPARVSPGVPDRWYAQIAGQWVEIIDCCPMPGIAAGKDCCDETQTKLNQMKLDIAKITELIGRNQAGEKCPDCDLSEIKRMIANIQFPTQKTYDDTQIREEMRAGFAEIRAMIGQIKQYDVSKDLTEIKELIKAIKIADTQAISDEVKQLRRMIETLVGQKTVTLNRPDGTSQPTDTAYFDSKWNELKELINSKGTVYQRDYSGELAQIQRDLDYFKTEFAKTKSAITTEISTTTSPEVKQDLSKLLTEQTDLFSKKIKELEVKLTKPCEECTEIAKLQSQMMEMKNLILAIKPGTNTTTIKEVPSQNTGEIDRLTKEIQNLRARFDEMDEAFTTQINTTTGKVQQEYKVQHDEQVDLYTTLIMRYETALKQLTNQLPELKTAPKTPIYVNGECTNCPKVVESHTRTIYEYPPVIQPEYAPCDEC